MMTSKQASIKLKHYETQALHEQDGIVIKKYGHSFLEIGRHPDTGELFYQWGCNMVDKAVALNVVQSFDSEPR